jgi:vacuolar-type H+-ATPase subunit H
MLLDMFGMFVRPLEIELGMKSNHRVGRFSDVSKSKEYDDRIEAINFSLAHDDGQSNRDLAGSDVILVGVSRSGKTPTSLYLAMQYGLKASNYPLIPEDFERRQLPPALVPHRKKIFGLTIAPERLAQIRNERRPNSKYASLENCREEIHEAEAMMRREGIRWLSTTTKSIEEIATTILQEIRPERLEYFLNRCLKQVLGGPAAPPCGATGCATTPHTFSMHRREHFGGGAAAHHLARPAAPRSGRYSAARGSGRAARPPRPRPGWWPRRAPVAACGAGAANRARPWVRPAATSVRPGRLPGR